ncbi:vacuolar protein sorting-associated protein 11 homolog [Hylaeus volcanicus]|uniref:vacuolar protein sorting-associated protein 11 homolog n=1 Tax=Hylaeus volcanicus TaxID=313075 RepID=UPI0023B7A9A4|nr:vacuolar protein sorting-associated protein 11 homolog [Hylaeus volcanicus]
MDSLRRVPFFDLRSVKIEDELNIFTQKDRNNSINRHPLLNYLPATTTRKFVTVVSGTNCLWLGRDDGSLVCMKMSEAYNKVEDASKDDNFNDCHYVASAIQEYTIYSYILTHLFMSKACNYNELEQNARHPDILSSTQNKQLQHDVFFTIGCDKKNEWTCKIFFAQKFGKFAKECCTAVNEQPKPARTIVLTEGQNRSRPTCKSSDALVIVADLNAKATKFVVGFSNGSIIYYTINLKNSKNSIRGRRLQLNEDSRQDGNVCHSSQRNSPQFDTSSDFVKGTLTNLVFGYSTEYKEEVLFITTTSTVSCIIVYDDLKTNVTLLFTESINGCLPQQTALLKSLSNEAYDRLFTSQENCYFMYTACQGNLCALPFASTQMCKGFKSYVVSVHKGSIQFKKKLDEDINSLWDDCGSSSVVSHVQRHDPPYSCLSILVDTPTLRFLCYTNRFQGVVGIVPYNEQSVLVITNAPDLEVFELREKTFYERINALLQLRLFDWAVKMCIHQNALEEYVMEIHIQHANYMFDKKFYDKAAYLYSKTIDYLESSFVISKFLEQQQLSSLLIYLKILYKRKKFSRNHFTLMFDCFCMSGDDDGFLKFLEECEETSSDNHVDWEAAVLECRIYGKKNLAKQIAKKRNLTRCLLSILIYDFDTPDEALHVLQSMDLQEASVFLLDPFLARPLLCSNVTRTCELIYKIITEKKQNISSFISLFIKVETSDSLDEEDMILTECRESKALEISKLKECEKKNKAVTLQTRQIFDIEFLCLMYSILENVKKDVDTAPQVDFGSLIVCLQILLCYQSKMETLPLSTQNFCLKSKEDVLNWPIPCLLSDHFKSLQSLLPAFCLLQVFRHYEGLLFVCERIASFCPSLRTQNVTHLWCYGALQIPLIQTVGNSDLFLNFVSRCCVKDSNFLKLAIRHSCNEGSIGLIKKLMNTLSFQMNQNNFKNYLSPLSVFRLLQPSNRNVSQEDVNSVIDQQTYPIIRFGDVKAYFIEQAAIIRNRTDVLRRKNCTDFYQLQLQRLQLRDSQNKLYGFSVHNKTCSLCHETIQFPMIQFLCCHQYHTSCLESNSKGKTCPLCEQGHTLKLKFLKENVDYLQNEDFENHLHKGNNPGTDYICEFLKNGFLNALY